MKKSSLHFGLALHPSETKVMKIVKNSQNAKGAGHIIVNNNQIIQNVTEFVYLKRPIIMMTHKNSIEGYAQQEVQRPH